MSQHSVHAGLNNVNNISIVSLGHVDDTDLHTEGENCFKKLTPKEVKSTAQPIEISVPDNQNQKQHQQNDEHVKAYEHIFSLFFKFAKILGIDVIYNWKPFTHFGFYFTVSLVSLVWVCIFYTQGKHMSSDPIRVLEPFGVYGTASSALQKLVGYVWNREEVISLFYCIRRICLQTLPGSRADILKSHLIKTLNFLKVFATATASCLGIYLACSLKAYFVDNELVSLMPLDIIFINMTSTRGFICGNCIMSGMGLFAGFGIVLYDGVFIFAIFMYAMKVELIEQDLKDLDEMWTDRSAVPRAYKHAYIRNICNKRQDLNRYIEAVKGIFGNKIFFYFCLNYFSQIVCLFEVTTNNWTPGYAIALVSFLEMMFFCVMGTKITIADDRLFSSIYTTKWYTYDFYSQKIIILLLHQTEVPNKIQLGPLGPLNVVTGITVVKSIYTYYTIMTEML